MYDLLFSIKYAQTGQYVQSLLAVVMRRPGIPTSTPLRLQQRQQQQLLRDLQLLLELHNLHPQPPSLPKLQNVFPRPPSHYIIQQELQMALQPTMCLSLVLQSILQPTYNFQPCHLRPVSAP
jgi:hypothetical protein